MYKILLTIIIGVLYGCSIPQKQELIIDVTGSSNLNENKIWLTHEHILVDFIGADSIQSDGWNHDTVIKYITPYLEELKEFSVSYFVDATPNYLGRDVLLLEKISQKTGIKIMTNTGLYGARNDKHIPRYVYSINAQRLAKIWISEYENGIEGTSIKPGFIKIGVDKSDTLDSIDKKLVKAAALTHLKTGLTIASHTGKAAYLWPQLNLIQEMEVSPNAFIWVHAQAEKDNNSYLKAYELGCWISLDGLGWNLDKHVNKLLFAKENGILNKILISHDAGWYDPQKETQSIKPYTNIFKKLYPVLKSEGFTDEEFHLLVSVNPLKAFSVQVKKL